MYHVRCTIDENMDEAIVKTVRYLVRHRSASFADARRQLVRSGLERWRVDYALEWLQAVSGCPEPRRERREDKCLVFAPELNLSRQAHALLVGLRALGVISATKLGDVLRYVFQLPEPVGVAELQEMLLHDVYERMLEQGEGIFIEGQDQWGSRN